MIRVRVRVVDTCSVFHTWWRIYGAINGAGKLPLINICPTTFDKVRVRIEVMVRVRVRLTLTLQRLIRLGLGLRFKVLG